MGNSVAAAAVDILLPRVIHSFQCVLEFTTAKVLLARSSVGFEPVLGTCWSGSVGWLGAGASAPLADGWLVSGTAGGPLASVTLVLWLGAAAWLGSAALAGAALCTGVGWLGAAVAGEGAAGAASCGGAAGGDTGGVANVAVCNVGAAAFAFSDSFNFISSCLI